MWYQDGGGWIWKEYGSRLVSRFAKDQTCNEDVKSATSLPSVFTHKMVNGKLKLHSYQSLVPWIIESYLDHGIRQYEDIQSRVIPALEKYHALSKKGLLQPGDQDIRAFCGIIGCKRGTGLEDILEKYSDLLLPRKDTVDTEPVYEDHLCKIYYPENKEQSCKLGRGTRWCTAAENDNMFDNYNERGNMYIIVPKKPLYKGEKYQIHQASTQYMNEKDEPASLIDLVIRFPGILTFIDTVKIKGRDALYDFDRFELGGNPEDPDSGAQFIDIRIYFTDTGETVNPAEQEGTLEPVLVANGIPVYSFPRLDRILLFRNDSRMYEEVYGRTVAVMDEGRETMWKHFIMPDGSGVYRDEHDQYYDMKSGKIKLCIAMTKKGLRCTNPAKYGKLCWVHKKDA